MVETKVSELDNDENVKLTSDNNGLDTPHTYIMDTVNEEENDTNDASDSDDIDLINADGRHSSATFVIQMDRRCEDLIDIDERERLAREHCDVGDDEDISDDELDCYSTHLPLGNQNEMDGESPFSNERFGAPVPTPNQLGIKDILSEDGDQVQDIKQKKYPVLPSIGRTYEGSTEEDDIEDDDDPTLNQLDYTREKMETEADFFADYRVNTSVVKPTPRNAPLPPIGQTYSPRNPSQ
jgi:hypothetical protein